MGYALELVIYTKQVNKIETTHRKQVNKKDNSYRTSKKKKTRKKEKN